MQTSTRRGKGTSCCTFLAMSNILSDMPHNSSLWGSKIPLCTFACWLSVMRCPETALSAKLLHVTGMISRCSEKASEQGRTNQVDLRSTLMIVPSQEEVMQGDNGAKPRQYANSSGRSGGGWKHLRINIKLATMRRQCVCRQALGASSLSGVPSNLSCRGLAVEFSIHLLLLPTGC